MKSGLMDCLEIILFHFLRVMEIRASHERLSGLRKEELHDYLWHFLQAILCVPN